MKYFSRICEAPNPDQNVFYLASPYSTPTTYNNVPADKEKRHLEAQKYGAYLHAKNYALIEPIATSHFKATKFNFPQVFSAWQKRDEALIAVSNGIIVCNMDGWEESVGVTSEIEFALSLSKPVFLVYVSAIYRHDDDFLDAPVFFHQLFPKKGEHINDSR